MKTRISKKTTMRKTTGRRSNGSFGASKTLLSLALIMSVFGAVGCGDENFMDDESFDPYSLEANAQLVIRDLVVSLGNCPAGYSKVSDIVSGRLNGDLNQGAGGKDIFLCSSTDTAKGDPIDGISVTENSCQAGYSRVPQAQGSNGDLNQSAGGKDIFVCSRRGFTQSFEKVFLSLNSHCDERGTPAEVGSTLNGDLNQGAGGSDIYLCVQPWNGGESVDSLEEQRDRAEADFLEEIWPGLDLPLTKLP